VQRLTYVYRGRQPGKSRLTLPKERASDLMRPCFGCSDSLEADSMGKPSSAKETTALPEKYF
jgi:hypothetical protein